MKRSNLFILMVMLSVSLMFAVGNTVSAETYGEYSEDGPEITETVQYWAWTFSQLPETVPNPLDDKGPDWVFSSAKMARGGIGVIGTYVPPQSS